MPPTVLAGVKPDAAVMQEEIFGPILPVLAVDDIDEAIRFVNDRDKPLALYVFTTQRRHRRPSHRPHVRRRRVLSTTPCCTSGSASCRSAASAPSGMGAYHGKAGFDTFSHRKSVLRKPTKPDPSIMYPPYKSWKYKLVRRFL